MRRILVVVVLICTGILFITEQNCLSSECYHTCFDSGPCSGGGLLPGGEGNWVGSGASWCNCTSGSMWDTCDEDEGGICKYFFYEDIEWTSKTQICLPGDYCNSA